MALWTGMAICVAVPAVTVAVDAPPAALRPDKAGGKGATMPATVIELDGSISENPEGGLLEYRWTQTDGPPVELSDPTSPKPNFRTAEPGVYVFELVVSSDGLQSEPHIVQLEIECENLPPVAKLPGETTAQVGKLFELDGGESFDPEGESLTYRWRPLTGGLELPLSALSKQVLSFEPTREGVYDIELVVSDGEKTSPPAVCRLTIRPRPKPPVARARVIALGPGGDSAVQPVILSSDTVPANSTQASTPTSGAMPPPPSRGVDLPLPTTPLTAPLTATAPSDPTTAAPSGPPGISAMAPPRMDPLAPPRMDALAPLPAMAAPQAPSLSSLPDIPPPAPLPAIGSAVPPFSGDTVGSPAPPSSVPVSSMPASSAAPFIPAAPLAGPSRIASPDGQVASASIPVVPGMAAVPVVSGAAYSAPGPASVPASFPPSAPVTTTPSSPAALPYDFIDRPVARIDAPVVTTMDSVVMLDGRGSVGLGSGRLDFRWRQVGGPFVTEFESVFNGAAERFRAPEPGDYEFELVVVDSGIESAPVNHRVTVNPGAEPPVAVVLAPERAIPGAIVRMDATRSYDPDGNPLVYRWRQTGGPAVKDYIVEENVGDAAPAFRPETEGIYSFELIVSNGKLNSRSVEIDIFVGNAAVPPVVTMHGPEAAAAGEAVTYRVYVENAPDRRFTFEWRQMDGPPGAIRQADGIQATVVPPRPGRYVFDVVAFENGRETGTARRVLEVFRPANGRTAPPRFVEPLPEYAEVRGRNSTRGASRVPDIQPLPNSAPLPDLPAASGGNRVVGSNRGLPAAQVLQGGGATPSPRQR